MPVGRGDTFVENLSGDVSVQEVPVQLAVAAVRDVVARHEGLRSVLVPADEGGWDQRVMPAEPGLAAVVRTAGPERAGPAFEEALATSFDLREQWPVLFVLSVEDDAVRRVAFVVERAAWARDSSRSPGSMAVRSQRLTT